MLTETLHSFLSFLQAHVWLAYVTIFFIALSESLALVGLVMPGAVLMFAIGTLITTGYLDFAMTVIWAALGAISGDGLSYWLGARYREQLQNLWPLSRYPGILQKGVTFFQRHGGKSVLFGRFVGPLRPIIPAIAGMLGMSTRQFLISNILSGLAWAPLYLLPGMAFGLSLEIAGEVAGRLVLWLLVLFISVLLVIWLTRLCYRFVLHHTERWTEQVLHWSHRHPATGQIPASLLEPMHSEKRGLAWLTLLFLFTVILLTVLIEFSMHVGVFRELERLIYHLPTFIHLPLADAVFGFFLFLNHAVPLSLLAIVISLWLAVQRQWLLLVHLSLAWCIPAVALLLLHFFGISSSPYFSVETSNLLLTASLLFFLGLLFANELGPTQRVVLYATLSVILFLILMAQLYWQRSGFITASLYLLIGVAWAVLIGIAYRRHLIKQTTRYKFIPLFAAMLLCGWALQSPIPEHHVATTPPVTVWSLTDWQTQQWQHLPKVREDLRQSHRYPFNLQWRGTEGHIKKQLLSLGWRVSGGFSWVSIMKSLQASPRDTDLVLLPHLHQGRYESLRWIKYQNGTLYVIRLWQSHIKIDDQHRQSPLWFGNISIVAQHSQLGWHYLRTTTLFRQALDMLRSESLSFNDKGAVLLLDTTS